MRGAYDVLELSTAVKPWLLRHMLRDARRRRRDRLPRPGHPRRQPDDRAGGGAARAPLVLTPHLTEAMPRDGKQAERDGHPDRRRLQPRLHRAERTVRRRRPSARLVVRAPADATAASRPHRGLFVDQRWVDFVPGLVADLKILRDPGYNIAYWNLPDRDLRDDGGHADRRRRAAALLPLQRLRPRQAVPSSASTRTACCSPTMPVVREICDDYGDALLRRGLRGGAQGSRTSTTCCRRACALRPTLRDALPRGRRGRGAAGLDLHAGGRGGLRRLAERADAGRGRRDLALPLRRLDGPRGPAARLPGPRRAPTSRGLHRLVLASTASVRSRIPSRAAAAVRRAGTQAGRSRRARGVPAATPRGLLPPPRTLQLPFGVNVAGYLRAELGVGEVGAPDGRRRSTRSACRRCRSPRSRRTAARATTSPARCTSATPFSVNLICVNADGLPAFAEEVGAGVLRRPLLRSACGGGSWRDLPERFDDVVRATSTRCGSASRFVAEALAPRSTDPVVRVPMPVDARAAAAAGGRRARLARRLHVPLLVRLQQRLRAQEPARDRRGLHAGVRAGRRRRARAEVRSTTSATRATTRAWWRRSPAAPTSSLIDRYVSRRAQGPPHRLAATATSRCTAPRASA